MLLFPSCAKITGIFPTRLNVGIMMFTACWVSYMLRVNMSINILEMVKVETKTSNSSHVDSVCLKINVKSFINDSAENEHINIKPIESDKNAVKYDWTVKQQGLILGSYFWGYVLTSLAGGFVSQLLGPRIVIGVTLALSGVLTILSPYGASLSYEVILGFRFLLGCLGGVVYPALHSLVANWAPPDEKGKFIGALMGGTFGTVVTWSLCGFLISYMGWEWAFYIPGIITLVWCVIWFFVVTDSPMDHPRIDKKEKDYILQCIGDSNTKTKKFPPLKAILLSIPFWAFTILHFGSMWGLYFQLTSGPKFISQVLGFDISKVGMLAGLPYMSRVLMGFVFGSIGDILRKKKTISVTLIRKIFVIFSHFLPGLLLIALTFVGCNHILSVTILTASLGINGAACITNLQNHQDLAPNYVGVLYSMANFLGSMTGFVTPLVTAHFTKERNGVDEWRMIFIIGAGVYCITGVIFMIIGTGEMQKWNNSEEVTKTESDKKPEQNESYKSNTETSFPNNKSKF